MAARDWRHGIAAGLLLIYAWLGLTAVRSKSTTFDEVAHLTAGYSYWMTGDYRLHPENGNWPQRWVALPLLGRYHFPPLDSPGWRQARVFEVGEQFFHREGNDVDAMLFAGRAMITVLGCAVGLIVYCWSRQLLGADAGLLSLALCVFCPTMLAHGCLATSDMAAAWGFSASAWACWSVMQKITWTRVGAAAVAVTLAALAKFSAVLIVPMAIVLLAVRLLDGRPLSVRLRKVREIHGRGSQTLALLGAGAVIAAMAWTGIWLAYGGRYAMVPQDEAGQDHYQQAWDDVLPKAEPIRQAIVSARAHRLLPEAYLYGFSYTLKFASGRNSFFNGDFGSRGWTMFFPYCLLAKTPLPLFMLLVMGAAAAGRRLRLVPTERRRDEMLAGCYQAAPLIVLLAVYWIAALTSHLNIGQRHLLPTYPAMFVLAGAAAWWWQRPPEKGTARAVPGVTRTELSAIRQRGGRWLWVATVAAFVGDSLWTWPNYLAYFNAASGGSWNGYRHLVDSSLDWGQDLPGLRDWLANYHRRFAPAGLEKGDGPPVYLSYFGTGDPAYYGISATLLPGYGDRRAPGPIEPLRGGLYCISATMLQGVYLRDPGPWSARKENQYQKFLAKLSPPGKNEPHAPMDAKAAAQFDELRFNRLCHFLRQREPDDEIGHSILIYAVKEEELQRYLFKPLEPAGPSLHQ